MWSTATECSGKSMNIGHERINPTQALEESSNSAEERWIVFIFAIMVMKWFVDNPFFLLFWAYLLSAWVNKYLSGKPPGLLLSAFNNWIGRSSLFRRPGLRSLRAKMARGWINRGLPAPPSVFSSYDP